ncbi:MAG TPA: cupredoxin domain-containing protein [Solirubrobacteraceae bacterium]|nr:cupredoxin domain-containing protein [Solirubrobacteraceae bacterium]
MRTRLPLLLTLLALLSGCGEEKSTGSGSGGGSPSKPATPSGGDVVQVKMKDILFVPDKITARVGQTVRWTNEDSVDHTVKAESGADFSSDPVPEGKTFETKLTEAGTIAYFCTIHPSQKGTITVER